jgi:hypothetical protein
MDVEKALKLMSYLALLALLVWVVASSLGQRSQLQPTKPTRQRKANGSVWARKSVPAASSQVAAAALPTPPQGI